MKNFFIGLTLFVTNLFCTHACATTEQTLSIIKPDAVSDHHIGAIINRLEQENLCPVAMKMLQLSPEQAKTFYAVHKERPFYNDLVIFMTSGPVVVMVLEGDDAVAKNRKVMGATDPDPKKAEKGTIRADFAQSVGRNAIHGSDSKENAAIEIAYFFRPEEIHSREK